MLKEFKQSLYFTAFYIGQNFENATKFIVPCYTKPPHNYAKTCNTSGVTKIFVVYLIF